jgi:hypothetical protein
MSSYKEKIKEVYGKDLENFSKVNDTLSDSIPLTDSEYDKLSNWILDLIIERNRMREEIDIFCDGCSTSWEELIAEARDEGY